MEPELTSTWPDFIFRKELMLAKIFPGGKFTLYGRELRRKEGLQLTVEKIGSGAAAEFERRT